MKSISKNAVLYPLLMLGAMWGVFFLQLSGFFQYCSGALIPLTPEGLKGVLFSPLLHGNLEHIAGNSIPIAALMFLLFQFYPFIAKKIFFIGWLAVGFLVWLLPPLDFITREYRYTCIVGASGIVYVLAFFLFFSGILRKNTQYRVVSLIVALYYGSLVWGVLPEELFSRLDRPSNISWQSHLAGAVVGMFLAFIFRKYGEKKKTFIWEFPNYYSEKDDRLWQEYKLKYPEDFREMPQIKADIWEHLEEIRKR